LNNPENERTLLNLYVTLINAIEQVNSSIAFSEFFNYLFSMLPALSRIFAGNQAENIPSFNELNERVRQYISETIRDMPSRLLKIVDNYRELLPKLPDFTKLYFEAHNIIAPVIAESTNLFLHTKPSMQ